MTRDLRVARALSFTLVLAAACRNEDPSPGTENSETLAQAPSAIAKVTAITGPGGLLAEGLQSGAFLGPGATLHPGQRIETPVGTLAEIAYGGARLRLNERTSLSLPSDGESPLVLGVGEVVAEASQADASSVVAISTAHGTVRVNDGATRIRHADGKSEITVVEGRARVEGIEVPVELGAGQTLTLPVQTSVAPTPKVTLHTLEDTAWARTFDQAAFMADEVPRGVGSLTARTPGSSAEQQRLRLVDQRVRVSIAGRIAHTEIEQSFFNDRPAVLEGIYRFPLPSDASISALSLLVGNQWMDGAVVEKTRGRAIFQQIVDATIPRDPALLEWERGNMFKLRVFPIPGNGDRRVRIAYTQVLPVVGDTLRYRYPIGGSGASGTPIDRFSFSVEVDRRELDQAAIDAIESPMIELDREFEADRVRFHTERNAFLPTFDLGLDIPVPPTEQAVHAQTHLDRDGQAYFMVALQPTLELPPDPRPVHYAVVFDRSHSVTPELWTLGRAILGTLSEGMKPDDRFTVLACDTACDRHAAGFVAPEPEAVAKALEFIDGQDLAGASDLGGMLMDAARTLDEAQAARRVIVYLGDGNPTSGELAPDKLVARLRDPLRGSRVMAVALGARSDLMTLGSIAQVTGGDVLQADPRDAPVALVRALRLRAEIPVLSDVRFELPEGMTAVRGAEATSLRPGESVVLTGKLRHPVDAKVRLAGVGPNGPVQEEFEVRLQAQRDSAATVQRHLPRTWANMEIEHLTRSAGHQAKDRIIELSQKYTVLSRYTAMIVLENDAMYREFNVVRRGTQTDRWGGEAGAPVTGSVPTEDTGTIGPGLLGGTVGKGGGSGTGHGYGGPPPAEAAETKNEETRTTAAPRSGDDPAANRPATPADPAPEPEPQTERGRDARLDNDEPSVTESDDDVPGGLAEPAPAPPPKATMEPKKAKKPSSGSGLAWDDVGGGWSDDWGGGRRGGRWHRPPPRLKVRNADPSSARELARLEAARRVVENDPTKRSAHSKLVRLAIRQGDPRAVEFARAWAESDPEHPGALRALADVLARNGDPVSLRAYESIVEIAPFSIAEHTSLANALERKGDLRRSCSHRLAVVSIDPTDARHHAALGRCLALAGRQGAATEALGEGRRRALTQLAALDRFERELAGGSTFANPSLGSGQLRVTLQWAGEHELDIAIVDGKGRRLSTMHDSGTLRVEEGLGREVVVLPRVKDSVFVEVTAGSNASEPLPPIVATVDVATPSGRRSFPVRLQSGSQRVAKVAWTR